MVPASTTSPPDVHRAGRGGRFEIVESLGAIDPQERLVGARLSPADPRGRRRRSSSATATLSRPTRPGRRHETRGRAGSAPASPRAPRSARSAGSSTARWSCGSRRARAPRRVGRPDRRHRHLDESSAGSHAPRPRLRRAYVAGDWHTDDLPGLIALVVRNLETWRPAPASHSSTATAPISHRGRACARPREHRVPLRPRQRPLPALPRRVDDLLLRAPGRRATRSSRRSSGSYGRSATSSA